MTKIGYFIDHWLTNEEKEASRVYARVSYTATRIKIEEIPLRNIFK